jgi:hypothetical protein
MRKIILAVIATSLFAASTAQIAAAAERHARHDNFRGAYNRLSTPPDTTGETMRSSSLPAAECPKHLTRYYSPRASVNAAGVRRTIC